MKLARYAPVRYSISPGSTFLYLYRAPRIPIFIVQSSQAIATIRTTQISKVPKMKRLSPEKGKLIDKSRYTNRQTDHAHRPRKCNRDIPPNKSHYVIPTNNRGRPIDVDGVPCPNVYFRVLSSDLNASCH